MTVRTPICDKSLFGVLDQRVWIDRSQKIDDTSFAVSFGLLLSVRNLCPDNLERSECDANQQWQLQRGFLIVLISPLIAALFRQGALAASECQMHLIRPFAISL